MNLKKIKLLSLFILPVAFATIGFFLKSEIPVCHLNCIDPDYFYLFNGLNLAHLSYPAMIDHPGTPLQIFSAIIIRVVHFFRPDTLDVDLFTNPEVYMSAIKSSLICLHAIVLFFLGFMVSKISGKILPGLFFQLTPFNSYITLELMRRLMIEQFFIFSVLLYILVTYIYLVDQTYKSGWFDKYVILFSLIVGFNLAIKITFFPLFLLPFILLPGFKKKIIYSIFSVMSFCIFAFPIFKYWIDFRNWVLGLFLHSGPYGSGKLSIMDKNNYFINLKTVLFTDYFFSAFLLVIIISTLIYHIPFLRVKLKNDKFYRILLGIALSMIVMVLLIAKQPTYWYLTPAFLLSIPGLFLVLSIYTRPFKIIFNNVYIYLLFGIFLFLIYKYEVKRAFIGHAYNLEVKNQLVNSMNMTNQKFKNKPTLVITNNFGCPYKEYGLYGGMIKCGDARQIYAPNLIKLYPQIYFYNDCIKKFLFWSWHWDDNYAFIDLLIKYQKVILMIGDPGLAETFASKLHGINRQIDTQYKNVYNNELTKETFYEVSYDSVVANKIIVYTCNAEMIDSTGNFFLNNYGQKFENGITQSKERARSGEFSSKLTKENPFGMKCFLSEVKKGEHYLLSVWKYNNNNSNAGLVVSSQDSKIFYILQTKPEKEQGMWQKLQIDLVIPEILNYQDIKIYCRNNDKNLPAYFDDLELKKL